MPPSAFHQVRFGHAQALQTQGRWNDAAAIYRGIIAEDPQNAPALHMLGLLMLRDGEVEGLELLRQSLAIPPFVPAAQENLGKELEKLGRHAEALAAYDRLAELAPTMAAAHAHRGRVLQSLLRHGEALAAFDRAIAAGQGQAHPLVHFQRGVALMALGRHQEALAGFDEALRLKPDYGDALVNRGVELQSLGRTEEALASFDRALAVNPDLPEARANRLALLARMGRTEEALVALGIAVTAEPNNPQAWNNRGSVLNNIGELKLALADFDKAIALRPGFAKAHSNRAIVLQALGRLDESLAALEQVIALDPAATAPLDKALVLLLQGRFAEGLPLYESRPCPSPPGLDPAQAWQGPSQDVAGKTVFVYSEQGLGDVFMLVRYLIELSALGAKVVMAVHDGLAPLLRSLPVPVTFIAENTRPDRLDYHAAIMSLPLLFGTRVETIPAPVPYLKAEPQRVARWRAHLGEHGFRIAIAWQGKTSGLNDARRSFPVAALAPLAALPGVRLISLQKGEGSGQLDRLPPSMNVERLPADFDAAGPFLDTAAVMEACDLVVTMDTSIVHLAGALGRPTWTALKSVPEWRWLLERKDSPWYPGMTLYRQPRFGDWDSVFAAMAHDLKAGLANFHYPS